MPGLNQWVLKLISILDVQNNTQWRSLYEFTLDQMVKKSASYSGHLLWTSQLQYLSSVDWKSLSWISTPFPLAACRIDKRSVLIPGCWQFTSCWKKKRKFFSLYETASLLSLVIINTNQSLILQVFIWWAAEYKLVRKASAGHRYDVANTVHILFCAPSWVRGSLNQKLIVIWPLTSIEYTGYANPICCW